MPSLSSSTVRLFLRQCACRTYRFIQIKHPYDFFPGHEGFPFAMSLSNIAACLRRLGRRTEAEAAYRRSIHIFRMLPQSGAHLNPPKLIS